ncbi:DUF6162 family protein [Pseudomonas guariconensis]|uniref:DUF6162 family protein n=1 Tax=Pseudomonas TaxID=286 RepID=UPI001CE42314|nr:MULTISPECIES: DUF6162 family protein [Pseudomonas]MCO7640618.1 DUF6162 family protein [Pseudomonas sp. S 311-6]MCO7516300.1 DUF6162 family protein [Pseudomonas putida]MCO7566057.1 DUF6162 family protein [Pseudomonas mosselii]MCO7596204.1 DUF6162 family protein [Pseudomonas guariconensis]MCO7606308.1 DUF6162 family protein [Pseudomonas guariconensis]
MSRAQLVRPAGAGHETLYVLLAAVLIVVLAATVVGLRGERQDEQAVASHQLDVRRDLNAAEQGIYTDLWVAFDEIQALREEQSQAPQVEALAEDGLPPFVADASSASRGNHQWQWLDAGAYLGRSQDAQVAGSFLLVLPPDGDSHPDVWLRRDGTATPPADLGQEALIAAGWQQVVSHYDAGVTRQHRH